MPDDPMRSYYGQPILPAGFNSWDLGGDEMNSPGTNEPIWPTLFDSFEALEVLIITQDMYSVFVTECPDYVVPCVEDTIVVRREDDTYEVKDAA